jgi:hypothetical protein
MADRGANVGAQDSCSAGDLGPLDPYADPTYSCAFADVRILVLLKAIWLVAVRDHSLEFVGFATILVDLDLRIATREAATGGQPP